MNLFGYRVMGAALLDASVYEGIEADRSALKQALLTVLLASVAAGIGSSGYRGPDPAAMLMVAALALVTWVAWAALMFQIGARLMPGPATRTSLTELMRTIGFAATPGLIRVFGFIPGVTIPAFIVSSIWMLMAMIVAVRQALDYKHTSRAIAVCVLGWALALTLARRQGAQVSQQRLQFRRARADRVDRALREEQVRPCEHRLRLGSKAGGRRHDIFLHLTRQHRLIRHAPGRCSRDDIHDHPTEQPR